MILKRRFVDLRDKEVLIGAVGARGIERFRTLAEGGIERIPVGIGGGIGIVPDRGDAGGISP